MLHDSGIEIRDGAIIANSKKCIVKHSAIDVNTQVNKSRLESLELWFCELKNLHSSVTRHLKHLTMVMESIIEIPEGQVPNYLRQNREATEIERLKPEEW